MGGRLWVESEAGRGSTFHFTARFAPAKVPGAMEAVPDAVDLRGLPVLVVDDNATHRRLLEQMLIGWGMVPTLAASVPEALAALRVAQESGRAFPLVLTDFEMPDADGFALAETIKKDPAIAGAAVVMLTSAGQPGDAARCRSWASPPACPNPSSDRNCAALSCRHWMFRRLTGIGRRLVTRHLPAGSAPGPAAFLSSRTTRQPVGGQASAREARAHGNRGEQRTGSARDPG
jgi:CheY-like chemotaxis protein